MPNIISMETHWLHTESHLCPWHQTLPFVIRRAPHSRTSPSGSGRRPSTSARAAAPSARSSPRSSRSWATPPGRSPRPTDAGFAALDAFNKKIRAAGAEALDRIVETGETAIVLVGRPYNVHDAGMNLSVGQKLRDYYGVNVIPQDFLDVDDLDVQDINSSMYWNLGHKILAAAKIVGQYPNLHIIYITNFKCGPDSFIKHFILRASGKPFLTLQFDSHANDAGMMTRCEAYLDSKGILRPWRREELAVECADRGGCSARPYLEKCCFQSLSWAISF